MTHRHSGFGRPIQFRFVHGGGDRPAISGTVSGTGLPILLPSSGRLPSTLSAAGKPALFEGFNGTTHPSDFSPPFIAGVRSCELPGAARDRRGGRERA
jgi:hypothetical protein